MNGFATNDTTEKPSWNAFEENKIRLLTKIETILNLMQIK